MKIFALCPEGHKLAANAELAGKQIKCPKCGAVVRLPDAGSAEPADRKTGPVKPPAPKSGDLTAGTSKANGPKPTAPQENTASKTPKPPAAQSASKSSSSQNAPRPTTPKSKPSKPAPEPTAKEDDDLFDDELSFDEGEQEDDSLYGGGTSANDDPWSRPSAGSSLPPAKKSLSQRTASKPAKNSNSALEQLGPVWIVTIVGAGTATGLLCIGFILWMFLGGSGQTDIGANNGDPPAVADSQTAQPGPTAAQPAAPVSSVPSTSPLIPAPGSVASQPAAASPSPPPVAEEPAPEPKPWELVRIELDPRLDGFRFPGTIWAMAYDDVSGRLAITNDQKGILIYDLDDLLAGKSEPATTFATPGLPTALCLKTLPDRRVFVFAGKDDPKLVLADPETLELVGTVPLGGSQYADFVTGSANPNDPCVYYSTTYESDRNDTPNSLTRINLVSGQVEGTAKESFTDVTVSANGQRLYARPDSTADGVAGDWSEVSAHAGSFSRAGGHWDRRLRTSRPYCLRNSVAVNNAVYNDSLTVLLSLLDYSPGAAFEKQPFLIGLGNGEVVFASANDYRRLSTIPLPGNWQRTDRSSDPSDFRARGDMSPTIKSAFLEITADNTRNLGLIAFGEHLIIAPLAKQELPSEPTLIVQTPFPSQLSPDEPLELELKCDVADAQFEFIPNTDWLPDEKTPLLGVLPPGQPSSRPLELHAGVSADQQFVLLSDYKPLTGLKFPFKLRIGNEVMTATKYDKTKMVVRRTSPVEHGSSERIAVVDDQGRLVKLATPPEPPAGKRLALSASINSEQTMIYLNDLRALEGEKLPLTIQIGDEKMVVVSVDDFKDAIIVKRTEPVSHSVSDDAWIPEKKEPASKSGLKHGPNLPVVEGRTFRWTPAADQLGHHRLRMRVTSGQVFHEWFWEANVVRGAARLPFEVVGIEPESGTNRAVIWGQSRLPNLNSAPQPAATPNTYHIAIYDLNEKRVMKQVEVPRPVMTATLEKNFVFASLISFDVEPKADRAAEEVRVRAATQKTATEIVRMDAASLTIKDRVSIPEHCIRLEVIAGKYLTGIDRWRSEVFRFNVRDLSPVEPAVGGYVYPIAGRVRDGWVWDGVVWDGAMKQPRLLLFPVHFEQPPGPHSQSEIMAAGGTIRMRPQGPFVCMWYPPNRELPGDYSLKDFPAGLSCADGFVHAYSWAAPSQPQVGRSLAPNSVRLVDLSTVALSGDDRARRMQTGGYVSEADGRVHVALLGRLYEVALDQLVQPEETFRFVEEQDQFALESGKVAKLSYSAPGAGRYQLQIWFQRPHFPDDQPVITADSVDGTFELAADAFAIPSEPPSAEELKRMTPAFQQLTGRKPRGPVFPIYVSVIAEHQDGIQKAGLAHSYLVEVPQPRP